MFRLPFNVYGAAKTFKKLIEIKQNEKKFLKFEIFLWKSSPHTPYKVEKDNIRSL